MPRLSANSGRRPFSTRLRSWSRPRASSNSSEMEASKVKNFPTRAPVGLLLGAVLGLVSIVPVFAIWHHYQPPLERFYFPQYIGSTLAQTPIGAVISFFHSRHNTRKYFVLMQGGRPVTSAAGLDPARHFS